MLLLYVAMIDDEKDQYRFADIYYRYRKQMLIVAQSVLHNREDAEDAVQLALLGIAKRIHAVPTGNEKVLKSYVLTAAKNAALSMLPKKQERDKMLCFEDLVLPTKNDLFEQVAASQDYDLLLRAMRQLPNHYREVLMLILIQEHSIKDAAAILHRREGTVRQQYNRGKKLLVELCRKEGMCFDEKHINAI